MRFLPLALSVLVLASLASASTLQVGPGKPYTAPCQAIAAAAPGDVIEVDATGFYDGDVCGWSKSGLTIRGVNGRAKIDAAGRNYGGKGIWVIAGNDTVIENIELSGASVPDRNGAGIRQEGANLTVRNSYFHHNENGILSGVNQNSHILIEYSEFSDNGYGDGYSHNLYIGAVKKLTFRFNYSHHARVGHLLKSRAAENHILYNRLTNETGNASYELDLPNGGLSYVIGNLIQQGGTTSNSGMLSYRMEGATSYQPSAELFVVNNTFVNDRGSGGTFVQVSSTTPTPAIIKNNIFAGVGTLTTQTSAIRSNNLSGVDPLFVNRAAYDYHLQSGSPAVNTGADPGTGSVVPLAPVSHYVHTACGEGRSTVSIIDIGAYELGGAIYGTNGCQAPQSLDLTLQTSSVIGPASLTANSVTLSVPAPSGGAVVALVSSSAAASVPSTVTIPAGQLSASFTVNVASVSSTTNVTITASYSGATSTATLAVNPQPVASLSSITLSPASVNAGSSSTGTVRLDSAVNTSTVVGLSSSAPTVTAVPSSVTIPAGATSATFPVTTGSVNQDSIVTISGSLNGVVKSAALTVMRKACTANTAATAVTICSPADGTVIASPMQLQAVAISTTGTVSAMKVYLDGTAVYTIKGASIDASIPVARGTRRVTVKAWNKTGPFSKTIYVTVQ